MWSNWHNPDISHSGPSPHTDLTFNTTHYFTYSCVKFPKSDPEFLFKDYTFPLSISKYRNPSCPWRISSNVRLVRYAYPYFLRVALISVLSILWYFRIIYLYLIWEMIFFFSRIPLLLLIPKSISLRYPQRSFQFLFSYVNQGKFTINNPNQYRYIHTYIYFFFFFLIMKADWHNGMLEVFAPLNE